MTDTIQLLSASLLQPNPFQPRGMFDKNMLQELADSIKTYGILEPLVVAHTPAGYQIIAGERRWRASQLAGLVEVPVIIKKTTPRGMLEMAIIENVQRVDFSPIERAQAFRQLGHDFGYTQGQIAKRVNKSVPYVSNTVKLLTLPDAVKDGLLGNLISEGHARALASISDQQLMIKAYKQILKESGSVRRAEELSRLYSEEGRNPTSRARKKAYAVIDKHVSQWQTQLNKLLKSKSEVKLTRSATHTRVIITLKGDPQKTQNDLEKLMKFSQ
jgi:ParB family transcriptional regulator, chromosome partitioning protein